MHIYFLFTVRLTNERVGVFLARHSVQHLVFISKKMFEDTKGVISRRKLKKDRQYNGQEKKRTNNDLPNITQNTEDLVIRTPLKTRGELFSLPTP